ncbi:MAG: hypothetical protein WA990_15895 [Rubrobacteraceae bacterium]
MANKLNSEVGSDPTANNHNGTAAANYPGAHQMVGQGRLGLVGLLFIQGIIGYEWLFSGLAKLFSGFIPAFGEELSAASQDAPDWFKSVLDAVVVPAPTFWGVAIAYGELLLGIGLIGAALLWGLRFERIPWTAHYAVLAVTALAAFSGAILAISLHFMNGNLHPWFIPNDGFEEGVDFDSVLPAMQFVIFVVSVLLIQRMRRQRPAGGEGSAATSGKVR